MLVLTGERDLIDHAGQDLGTGAWLRVTQAMVDGFAAITGDDQWIHVDRIRAKAGPFGGAIAHGFLTLSLLPELTRGIYRVDGFGMAINYGLNRVRFPAPVPVDANVRASVLLAEIAVVANGIQAEFRATVSVEGATKPSCVAEYLSRYYA